MPHRFLAALAPLLLATGAVAIVDTPPAVAAGAQVAGGETHPGRPVILMVHGRGHGARDSAQVRRSAQAALAAGLRAQGLPPGELLQDGDVRMVWYADIASDQLIADAVPGCSTPAGEEGEALQSGFSLVAGIFGALLDAAGDLDGTPHLRDLRADIRYVADRRVQCAAEQRLHEQVVRAAGEGRPVVVVAHSMGALVSWGYLQRRASWPDADVAEITRLVTVGSPLGSPDVRTMVFGHAGAGLTLPRGVRAWVNVLDPDDPFAAPVETASPGTQVGLRQVDVWTKAGRVDPHLFEGYLSDPAGAHAVIEAWCDAGASVPIVLRARCGAVAAR